MTKKIRSILYSNHGNIVLQMLTILGGVGALVAALVTSQLTSLKESKATSTKIQIEGLRSQFLIMLKSNQAWINTLKASNNPDLNNCLANATLTSCGSNPWGAQTIRSSNWPIQLIDDENNKFPNDISNPSSGFTMNGKNCTSFDPVNGSNECPFQVQTTWRRYCLSGTCTNGDVPGVELYIDFIYKPQDYERSINTTPLNIRTIKSGPFGGESVLFYKSTRDTSNGYNSNDWHDFINGSDSTNPVVCMTHRNISQSINMTQRQGWVTVSASGEAQFPFGQSFASDLIMCVDNYCTSHKTLSAAGEPLLNSDSRSVPLAKRSTPYTVQVVHRVYYIDKSGGVCNDNYAKYPTVTKTFIDITVFRND